MDGKRFYLRSLIFIIISWLLKIILPWKLTVPRAVHRRYPAERSSHISLLRVACVRVGKLPQNCRQCWTMKWVASSNMAGFCSIYNGRWNFRKRYEYNWRNWWKCWLFWKKKSEEIFEETRKNGATNQKWYVRNDDQCNASCYVASTNACITNRCRI